MSLLRRAPSPTADATLACPRDASPLQKRLAEGVTIDRCDTCHGTWFDQGELRRVGHERALEREATRGRAVPLRSPFACPRCGAVCHVAHVEEVAVDACSSCHGVWLDAGELEEARRQIGVRRAIADAGPGFRTFLARL